MDPNNPLLNPFLYTITAGGLSPSPNLWGSFVNASEVETTRTEKIKYVVDWRSLNGIFRKPERDDELLNALPNVTGDNNAPSSWI